MGAKITDPTLLLTAGIDPKTGLPIKFSGASGSKGAIKQSLRIIDEQTAINRYVWHGLPQGLTSQMMERIMYYRGQGMFFYLKANDSFYFLPYALDSGGKGNGLDVYGRYTSVTPLPFNGMSTGEPDKKNAWIKGLTFTPVYDVLLDEENDDPVTKCVLINDYSHQMSQSIVSRQIVNEPLLDLMSEAYCFARTNFIANSGIKGFKVLGPEQALEVDATSRTIKDHALNGEPYVAIRNNIETQELAEPGGMIKTEEYLMYMQSLDNYRLSTYGLDSGGIFEKKAHMLQAENDLNAANNSYAYQDGLTIRQHCCDVINSVFGLSMWCDEPMAVQLMETMGAATQPMETDNTPATTGGNDNASTQE